MSLLKLRSGFEWLLEVITMFLVVALTVVVLLGVSFRYTAEGPEGLLTGKRAFVAYTAAGTPMGSDLDHASGYLRHMLGFLGITDVTFVAADGLAMDREAGMARAQQALEQIAA